MRALLAAAQPQGGRATTYSVAVPADQADEVAAVYSILGRRDPARPDEILLLSYDNNVDFEPSPPDRHVQLRDRSGRHRRRLARDRRRQRRRPEADHPGSRPGRRGGRGHLI